MRMQNIIQSLKRILRSKWSMSRVLGLAIYGLLVFFVYKTTVNYYFPRNSVGRSDASRFLTLGKNYTVDRLSEESKDYVIGRLNQTYVKIPKECIFLDVEYVGENPWDASTRIKGPITYDTPIATTNLIINAKTFKTVCTKEERRKFFASQNLDVPETLWFIVVLNEIRVGNALNPNDASILPSVNFANHVEQLRNRKTYDTIYGKKNREGVLRRYRKTKVYGIEKFVGYLNDYYDPFIPGRPTQRVSGFSLEEASYDYYLTDKGDPQPNIINCSPFHEIARFRRKYCNQSFVNKKLQFEVEVDYKFDQIPHWREVEVNLVNEISRFVVMPSNAQPK